MPLSIVFTVISWWSFFCGGNSKMPEKSTNLPQVTDKLHHLIHCSSNWMPYWQSKRNDHVINFMMFHLYIPFSMSDFMKVLGNFSNYWHRETYCTNTNYSQTSVPQTRMGRTDLKVPSIFLIFLSKNNPFRSNSRTQ